MWWWRIRLTHLSLFGTSSGNCVILCVIAELRLYYFRKYKKLSFRTIEVIWVFSNSQKGLLCLLPVIIIDLTWLKILAITSECHRLWWTVTFDLEAECPKSLCLMLVDVVYRSDDVESLGFVSFSHSWNCLWNCHRCSHHCCRCPRRYLHTSSSP